MVLLKVVVKRELIRRPQTWDIFAVEMKIVRALLFFLSVALIT